MLPKVSIVTVPEEGAVQLHHTDAGPEVPAGSGSPGSAVAPTFVPGSVTKVLANVVPGKASLAGCAAAEAWNARTKAAATPTPAKPIRLEPFISVLLKTMLVQSLRQSPPELDVAGRPTRLDFKSAPRPPPRR